MLRTGKDNQLAVRLRTVRGLTKVHKVKVEGDGAHDVLVWRQARVDQVRIVDDVAAEDEAAADRVDETEGVREGKEQPDVASHHCIGMSNRP